MPRNARPLSVGFLSTFSTFLVNSQEGWPGPYGD
jgi:hypothetical protein